MNRRWFLGASLAAVGSVFVPQYGGWYRAGSGLLVPTSTAIYDLGGPSALTEVMLRRLLDGSVYAETTVLFEVS